MTNAISNMINTKQIDRQTTDEQSIQTLFQQLFVAWGAGDANAHGALFSEDADYIAFDGVNQKGRSAIIASHQPLFDKWLKGSRLTGQIDSLRFLAPDVALIHASGSILDPGRFTPAPERASSQTLVAQKFDDGWRFVAFHNTRIRPMGQTAGGTIAWLIFDRLWRWMGIKATNAALTNTSTEAEPFAPLHRSRTALLTTFRRNGEGVSTPVTVFLNEGKAYFTTWTTTGKVKRLAHNPYVTLAPCTQRGKVLGAIVSGTARCLEGSEAQQIDEIGRRSFGGWLWRLIYKFKGWEAVHFEVTPVEVRS